MKCVFALAVLSLALVCHVQSQIPPYTVFPPTSRRCCAQAHQCYRKPFWNPPCRYYTRPSCRWFAYRRCNQYLILLRRVWVRFRRGRTNRYFRRCCRVLNCRKIYYTRCSFQVDRCRGYQRLCAPRYYRRYRLRVWCSGVGIRYTYRYFPHCCVCRFCPLRYFRIVTVPSGK